MDGLPSPVSVRGLYVFELSEVALGVPGACSHRGVKGNRTQVEGQGRRRRKVAIAPERFALTSTGTWELTYGQSSFGAECSFKPASSR